jgi:hypothetical protein
VSSDALALLIVISIPAVALLALAYALKWGRDILQRSPAIGGVGMALTLVAIGNLFVERTCDDGRNRAIVAGFASDHGCHRVGLLSLEAALLAFVATSVVVRLGDLRR